MKKTFLSFTIALCGLGILALGGLSQAVLAEEGVSKDQLVRSLKAKPVKRLTRGLGKNPEDAERKISRGLVIEVAHKKVEEHTEKDRKEIVKIVKKYELPTIDLTIYFDYNSAKITSKSIPTLVKLGQALMHKDLKGGTFLVGGHTDARGSDDYNLTLSQRRALAVKSFLIESFNITNDKLVAIGFGEEELKDVDFPDSGLNRRVQVTNLTH